MIVIIATMGMRLVPIVVFVQRLHLKASRWIYQVNGNPTKKVQKIIDKAVEVSLPQIYSKEEIKKGLIMAEHDNVNHPAHYERDGAIECIDEMMMIFGSQAVMDFCKCNAWKYRYRAADKNGSEDISKSDWYMRKYKELAESLKNNRDNFI